MKYPGNRDRDLLHLFKNMPLTITGLRDFKEAIITKGGVSVKDINPSTMESKLVQGLYFCGEVLDLDALTGGYNLQIAWFRTPGGNIRFVISKINNLFQRRIENGI